MISRENGFVNIKTVISSLEIIKEPLKVSEDQLK